MQDIIYQRTAVEDMRKKVRHAIDGGEETYLFQAPTGSGKTVMTGRFMQEWLEDNPDTAFIWLSPGKGDLAGQSYESISSMFSLNTLTLSDLMIEREISKGDVVFINWEAVRSEGNIVRRTGEKMSLSELIALSSVSETIIIVDESHEARDSVKSEDVIRMFQPTMVIDVTATPRKQFGKLNRTIVPVKDVIEAGFIKNQIILNENLTSLDTKDIIRAAMNTRDEVERRYRAVEPDTLTPLVLIQIENDKKVDGRLRADVIYDLCIEAGIHPDHIAVWTDKTKRNLDDIRTSDVRVLIFKSAIATGYDIPRAHVLVKLRDVKSDVFNTQILGRVMRTVHKKHYGDPVVDSAYVYTEFDTFQYDSGVDDELRERTKKASLVSTVHPDMQAYLNFTIPAEIKTERTNVTVKTEELYRYIERHIERIRENFGPISESEIVASGVIEAEELDEGTFNSVTPQVISLSDSRVRTLFKSHIRKLSKVVDISNMVQAALRANTPKGTDVLRLYLSNRDLVDGALIEAVDGYFTNARRVGRQVTTYTPPETVMLSHEHARADNYAYTRQPDLDRRYTRSRSEQPFADFLSSHPDVRTWWKNGVSGGHFSLYYTRKGQPALYYPDFMVLTADGTLHILDVKSETGDEDFPYIADKYHAGRQYEANYDLPFPVNISIIKFRNNIPFVLTGPVWSDHFDDPLLWEPFLR